MSKSIDFSKIVLRDMADKAIADSDFHKTVANSLYHSAQDLDFVDIALEINRGNAVDLTDAQIAEVRRVVDLPESRIATHARKALHDFLE